MKSDSKTGRPETAPITRLLAQTRDNDPKALEELYEAVYPVLHAMAANRLGNQSGGTLTPTVVVNELFLKIADGTVFDSSVDRGEPATFGLNQVITGWTEGVQLMTPGSKYQFYIPYDLAYGERGSPPNIAAGETLIFDIELIKVNETKAK